MLAGRDPVILTDALGRDLLRLEPGVNRLDRVPSGVYFLRTAGGSGRFAARIVKVGKE
jgi:predicted NAD/FAD-binding protein